MPKPIDRLVYSLAKADRATVKRQYIRWRLGQTVPERCDNPTCKFHEDVLVWNGGALPLILDHANGNSYDNRPENLRLLCPNCDSQLTTRGGKNRGRIRNRRGQSYEMWDSKGQVDALVLPTGREMAAGVGEPMINAKSGDSEGRGR